MPNLLIWIIDEEWPDYNLEWELLEQAFPGCTIRHSGYDYQADLKEFGHRADAILAQVYVHIPQEVIAQLECCRAIAVYGGGFDRIDVAAARQHGIPVTNVQGYCAEDIADYVMAAIYHFNKRINQFSSNLSNGLWGTPAVDKPIRRLSGSTLMVVGCGQIGRTVAQKAGAAGLRVVGYDPMANEQMLLQAGIERVELNDGLAQADFVSVHVNYSLATDGLLGMEQFRRMKRDAILINAARGRILVEQNLIVAVDQGVIGGAVVDVISNEPPTPDEAIFGHKNLIVTPHVSYISEESHHELKLRAITNLIKMLQGEHPADLVNG